MTTFFIITLVLSILYLVFMGVAMKITNGGFIAVVLYKVLPVLLAFSQCILAFRLTAVSL